MPGGLYAMGSTFFFYDGITLDSATRDPILNTQQQPVAFSFLHHIMEKLHAPPIEYKLTNQVLLTKEHNVNPTHVVNRRKKPEGCIILPTVT
jgi:hypothetical protein